MTASDARYIALLRGINVGGKAKVSMAWLREAYESVGCEDVATYLQSGNVVFRRTKAPTKVSAEVAALIKRDLGLDIAILDRKHDDLVRILGDDLFPDADPSRRLVVFLSAALPAAALRSLEELSTERETIVARTHELQLSLPDGIGRSKLAEALGKKKLPVIATARNWRTVTKLGELSAPADRP